MSVWIFNTILYFWFLGNPAAYQSAVQQGATQYSCVNLSTHTISNTCSQPMPKNVY